LPRAPGGRRLFIFKFSGGSNSVTLIKDEDNTTF
jgi:hypothetical protein